LIQGIDKTIFFRIFQLSIENPSVGDIMVVITNASSIIFALLYGLLLLSLFIRKDRKIFLALFGPMTAFLLVYGIRLFYQRPRPFIALDIESLIVHEASASMPSMHAASAFAIAMAVYYTNKSLGIIALALAALTGLSRVMVGVHFPLDILSGALLSVMVSYGIYRHWSSRNNPAGFNRFNRFNRRTLWKN
jgi:undecaprenyl-diphosphatase